MPQDFQIVSQPCALTMKWWMEIYGCYTRWWILVINTTIKAFKEVLRMWLVSVPHPHMPDSLNPQSNSPLSCTPHKIPVLHYSPSFLCSSQSDSESSSGRGKKSRVTYLISTLTLKPLLLLQFSNIYIKFYRPEIRSIQQSACKAMPAISIHRQRKQTLTHDRQGKMVTNAHLYRYI